MPIMVENDGPRILSTDYFDSELSRAGKYFVSVNAGTIRILVPPGQNEVANEMKTAMHCVLSRGPWPQMELKEAVEIVFDDLTDNPFSLSLAPESFDMLPSAPEPGRTWMLSVWIKQSGRPHKEMERICYWRRVESLPYMMPWEE